MHTQKQLDFRRLWNLQLWRNPERIYESLQLAPVLNKDTVHISTNPRPP